MKKIAFKPHKHFSDISKLRQELRSKFPYLNLNQVRRAKLPFHEALLSEMKEENFHESFEFFNSLIQIDIKKTRKLVRDKILLETIYNALIEMERTPKEKFKPLLRLAKFLSGNESSPVWVTEEIFKKSLSTLRIDDSPISKSSIHFFYGKWLNEKLGLYERAICHLKSALENCLNDESKLSLLIPISDSISEALKCFSIQLMHHSPKDSLNKANEALNYSKQIKLKVDQEVEIEIQIARCHLKLKNFEKAENALNEALILTEDASLPELKFESLRLLSECKQSFDDESKYEEILNLALQHAVKNSMKSAEAEALVLHGKFLISKQPYDEALKKLRKALKFYEQEKETRKILEVSFLMALPIGLMINILGSIVKMFHFSLYT